MTAPRPADAPPMHSAAAHEAIAAELVRCTLTGDHRPELSTLPADVIARAMRVFIDDVANAFAGIARTMSKAGRNARA